MISKWERKAAIKNNASFASNSSFAELVISLVLTLPHLTHNGSNTEVTLDVRLGLGRFLVLLVGIQPDEGTILVELVQLQITLIFPQAIIVIIDDVFLILVVIDRVVRTSIIIPAKIQTKSINEVKYTCDNQFGEDNICEGNQFIRSVVILYFMWL